MGYIEEEAVKFYNAFATEIRKGRIDNVPAPELAVGYYHLPEGARLIDVVCAVCADEASHRDANHHLADDGNATGSATLPSIE